MAIEDDVLVIGGGIAGVTAALSAADGGADVRLVTHKQSTLRSASGLIDVLGYLPASAGTTGTDEENEQKAGAGTALEGPVVDPFEAIPQLPESHPYRTVGVDTVREALAFFDEMLGDDYVGAHTDDNALVPTHGGSVKPTARYPTSTAAGLASDPRDVLLVGFETLPSLEAPLAAAHLEAAGAPFEARGVTLSFPGIVRDDAKVTRYAHLLDHDEAVPTDSGETGAREALAAAVEPHIQGESRVGFPAVLGDDHPDDVRATLEEALGVDVFEVPMGPPSLPGLRLEDRLYATLESAGVEVRSGVPVIDYETDESEGDSRRIDRVVVDRNGAKLPHRATEYVLATGGLVGKGIGSNRERVTEPIFDCHVPHATDRYDWFSEDAFGDHPFARFGVVPDDGLRPLDGDGDPEFVNLRAAGAVLGGYDYAAEKSGSGVSIATGYLAGRRAAERVAETRNADANGASENANANASDAEVTGTQ
ncbi:glycerol-3-phosphate dehydrogenase subunit GlpB [Halobiforma nitratireducens]|uniref:Anaerobic glycerol-3-phosphate dehydrogenase subunit B n=1 Tax=Halobiforma nitratireducens JCM 10879 TaxID=1227454 RepID=M0LSB9_9EURY|nr:glycerol-3-phosphate dehydrogenase subunit GlpB [Halobiforma nitratireducens]EMA35329.1 anaerobic glycerol-3-phosphate dehydrogenase subunit B [Halobiforma nitratireducens JCM 10879]